MRKKRSIEKRAPIKTSRAILIRPSIPLNAGPRGWKDGIFNTYYLRWLEVFGDPVSRDIDDDEFFHNAIHLLKAIDGGYPVYIVGLGDKAGDIIGQFNTTEPFNPDKPFALVGKVLADDPMMKHPGADASFNTLDDFTRTPATAAE